MEHTQDTRLEIVEGVLGPAHSTGLGSPHLDGDRIDGEVAAPEVFGHRGAQAHLGQRARLWVALSAGGGQVQLAGAAAHERRPEALVALDAGPQLGRQRLGQRERVALHQHVDLPRRAVEQGVADIAADHMDVPAVAGQA